MQLMSHPTQTLGGDAPISSTEFYKPERRFTIELQLRVCGHTKQTETPSLRTERHFVLLSANVDTGLFIYPCHCVVNPRDACELSGCRPRVRMTYSRHKCPT